MFSINFERHYKNGKRDHLLWEDTNNFNTYKQALEFGIHMVNVWKEEEDELTTFNIISH